MTTTAPTALDLQRAAREHLWLHFTRMSGYRDTDVPIIVRGDGCCLEDINGKRYLDALAGRRGKAISRHIAYQGPTRGALSINGIPAIREPFEPLVPEVLHVRNTNRYHRPEGETEEAFTALLLDELEQTIEAAGPETVA